MDVVFYRGFSCEYLWVDGGVGSECKALPVGRAPSCVWDLSTCHGRKKIAVVSKQATRENGVRGFVAVSFSPKCLIILVLVLVS
jgi:hypothetical protein